MSSPFNMSSAIGVNLRVTGHSSQGGRKYMEDFFSVAYQHSEDEQDLEFAFFGIFDGHGGADAAAYAKEHLMRQIVNQKLFWSDNDEDVLRAIREGYIATHRAMWKEQEKWPRTPTGLPSTAGTTATVAFIRHGKMYIGHVGDSGIVLGYEDPLGSLGWKARPLTQDHKPECDIERSRIMSSGGKVVLKSGVSRVVWTRPRLGHKGPIRRSTPIDEIPFLAVARSLGDLWSYNSSNDEFVVSPEPDVHVIPIDKSFRCLIFGTDGLWNVLSPNAVVDIVRNAEYVNDRNYFCNKELLNPSRSLVNRALEKWSNTRVRADNTSVVTILLDPPGGPKRKQYQPLNRCQPPPPTVTTTATAGHYDWHTMEEACLNTSGQQQLQPHQEPPRSSVEEELDLLNESLYNHTHQFNPTMMMTMMDMSPGGDFNPLLTSPSSSNGNYENYMNLSALQQQQATHSHQQMLYQRPPPPGGYLQSHLQQGGNMDNMLPTMAMPFGAGDCHDGDYDRDSAQRVSQRGHCDGEGADTANVERRLPTFSHLMEETTGASSSSSSSYCLTRLETRMEQLTNSAASTSMYANYQQLIETTSNYSPQVDLNTINTFHDYAGIPEHLQQQNAFQHHHHNHQLPSMGDMVYESSPLLSPTSSGMAMEHLQQQQHQQMVVDGGDDYGVQEGWCNQWQHQETFLNAVKDSEEEEEEEELDREEERNQEHGKDVDLPTSTDGEEKEKEEEAEESLSRGTGVKICLDSVPHSPTIQSNEISSSAAVVPTVALTQQQQQHPPPTSGLALNEVEESPENPLVAEDHPSDAPQNTTTSSAIKAATFVQSSTRKRRARLRSRAEASSLLSSSSSVVEKENKQSQQSQLPTTRFRRETSSTTAAATSTVAVTTRRSAATALVKTTVATRKSTAAAALLKSATVVETIKSTLRSKQVAVTPSSVMGGKTRVAVAAEKLLMKCGNSTTATTNRRNLLSSSTKFNQQRQKEEEEVEGIKRRRGTAAAATGAVTSSAPGKMGGKQEATMAAGNCSGIGRRLSKRDKVRRSVTKSTVQTRNRVQKR